MSWVCDNGHSVEETRTLCIRCGLDRDPERNVRPADRQRARSALPVTTAFEVPGKQIDLIVGVVSGNTVRTRHLGAKLAAGVTSNFGGELSGYTRLLTEARDEALERLLDTAVAMGADAVIGFSYVISEMFEVAVEVLAYGTAVKLREMA